MKGDLLLAWKSTQKMASRTKRIRPWIRGRVLGELFGKWRISRVPVSPDYLYYVIFLPNQSFHLSASQPRGDSKNPRNFFVTADEKNPIFEPLGKEWHIRITTSAVLPPHHPHCSTTFWRKKGSFPAMLLLPLLPRLPEGRHGLRPAGEHRPQAPSGMWMGDLLIQSWTCNEGNASCFKMWSVHGRI